MALTFGRTKESFSDLADNLLGIPIYEYGENRMPKHQIEDFRNTLTALHKDYPDIFRNELQSIHLVHDQEAIGSAVGSFPVLKNLVGIHNLETLGSTMRAKPGIEGSIGISTANINLFGYQGGTTHVTRGRDIEPTDVLNHEFGHTVHNFLSRPTHENPTDGDYTVAKRGYLSRFSKYLKGNSIEPATIGSRYAAESESEMFAETFARARSQTGQGFPRVAPIEKAFRSHVVEKTEHLGMKKMAANSRNAYKALRAMGSGLR